MVSYRDRMFSNPTSFTQNLLSPTSLLHSQYKFSDQPFSWEWTMGLLKSDGLTHQCRNRWLRVSHIRVWINQSSREINLWGPLPNVQMVNNSHYRALCNTKKGVCRYESQNEFSITKKNILNKRQYLNKITHNLNFFVNLQILTCKLHQGLRNKANE